MESLQGKTAVLGERWSHLNACTQFLLCICIIFTCPISLPLLCMYCCCCYLGAELCAGLFADAGDALFEGPSGGHGATESADVSLDVDNSD